MTVGARPLADYPAFDATAYACGVQLETSVTVVVVVVACALALLLAVVGIVQLQRGKKE